MEPEARRCCGEQLLEARCLGSESGWGRAVMDARALRLQKEEPGLAVPWSWSFRNTAGPG